MKIKFVVVSIFVLVLPVMSGDASAGIKHIADAINKAGRQRMLTQRMSKAYCMYGIDVQAGDASRQLDDAIALFESQLRELLDYAPTGKIRNALLKVKKRWRPFRKAIKGEVNVRTAKKLLEIDEALLAATNTVVVQLQDYSGSSQGRLVNVSGRQRMLSQRLAKFYMLRSWGVDTAGIRNEMGQAENEFEEALAELQSASENTPEIKQALKQARSEWGLFKYGLDRNKKKLVPLIVSMTSEKLLQRMNRITAMYSALPQVKKAPIALGPD